MKNKLEKIQSFVESLEKEKLTKNQQVTLVVNQENDLHGGDGAPNGTCPGNDYCDSSTNTVSCINVESCKLSTNRRYCLNEGDCTGAHK